jgi:hypothetical protein
MGCRARTAVAGFGAVACVLNDHGTDTWHRWQAAQGGTAIAVEWGDDRRRVGFAELNGLQTVLSKVDRSDADALALALSGWLGERPDVLARLLAHLGISRG